MYQWALAFWLAFLLLAIPYVRQARHPSARPLAAYLLFVTVFSLCSAALYFALTRMLVAFNGGALLSQPAGAAGFLALVLVPAFLTARWQLRRPAAAAARSAGIGAGSHARLDAATGGAGSLERRVA